MPHGLYFLISNFDNRRQPCGIFADRVLNGRGGYSDSGVDDFCNVKNRPPTSQVTYISNLLATKTVLNVRHQRRCILK